MSIWQGKQAESLPNSSFKNAWLKTMTVGNIVQVFMKEVTLFQKIHGSCVIGD